MPYYKPMSFTSIKAYHDAEDVEITNDGMVNMVELMMVATALPWEKSREIAVHDMWDDLMERAINGSWPIFKLGHWAVWRKFTFREVNGKKIPYMTLPVARVVVFCSDYFQGRHMKMDAIFEEYINTMPTIPEPLPKPADAMEEDGQEEEASAAKCKDKHGYAMCSLHKKRKTSCTGCLALHKQNPTKYPCPSAICKIHLQRKSRCACKKVSDE